MFNTLKLQEGEDTHLVKKSYIKHPDSVVPEEEWEGYFIPVKYGERLRPHEKLWDEEQGVFSNATWYEYNRQVME